MSCRSLSVLPLLRYIVSILFPQSSMYYYEEEQFSETNSSVSDEEQLGENSSVTSECSSSPSKEEEPISLVLSSSPDVINTCEEEQIMTSPTSEPLWSGTRVSQISVLNKKCGPK